MFKILLISYFLLSQSYINPIECNCTSYIRDNSLKTKLTWFLKGKRKFIISTELNLCSDSTFSFKTCGCTSSGTWYSNDDYIYLNHTTIIPNNEDAGISKCYIPQKYNRLGKKLIGINKGKRVEILNEAK